MFDSQKPHPNLDIDLLLAKVADPRVLQLIILPTEHCNFRCTYCYEDFKIGRMSPETVAAIKRWIDTRVRSLTVLDISWFGGEPTLALPIVHDITVHARAALHANSQTETRFHGSMTTNAYRLTPEVFERLTWNGVTQYQITLDGPRDVHDTRRVRADGKGTFDVVWSNLTGIAKRAGVLPPGVRIDLRLHYDGSSVGMLEQLVDSICQELLPSNLFQIQFHELERLGGTRDQEIVVSTTRDHQVARELARKVAKETAKPAWHVAADMSGYVCYAAKANSFVVRADGRLGKCTVALNDPRNDVGRLNADGTIRWNEGRMGPWLRGLESGDSNVLACPLDGMAGFVEKELRRVRPQVPVQ